MASIHPSRQSQVLPPLTHALPPRPTAPTSVEPSLRTGMECSSREEELKKKLLARKTGSVLSRHGDGEEVVSRGVDGTNRIGGMQGKELLGDDSNSFFGILGRAKRVREQSRERRDEGDKVSREGLSDDRGDDARVGTHRANSSRQSPPREDRDRNETRLDRDRYDRYPQHDHERDRRHRSISPVRMRREDSPKNGQSSRSFIHPDRIPLQSTSKDHPVRSPRRDTRNERGYSDWLDRRNASTRDAGGGGSERRERHDLPPRPSSRPPLPLSPRHGGDRETLSSRERNGSAPAMPPFPPNRRLTAADFEQRRIQRDQMEFSIWPASPPHPWRDPDEVEEERRRRKDKKRGKKFKRRSKYSSSGTESSDSEYERRRRRRREKERRKKYSDTDDSGDDSRRKKLREKTATRSRTMSEVDSGIEGDIAGEEDMWVEKGGTSRMRKEDDGSGEDDYGPKLPTDMSAKDRKRAQYTGMLYGEAEAMELYAAEGKRIPRRGEIGMDAEKIEEFEAAGYVMSGNRHKRMNAVRIRKENQVINAEEKRAILKLQREEKVRKEGAIVSQFREMLEEKLREGKEDR